jgi:glycerophosphoryl diester phosphodiesterase
MKKFLTDNPVKFSELGKVKGMPENTFRSIDEAFRQGADVVTLYFRLSSDLKLVSVPEADLSKYTGDNLKVSGISADELKNLDAAYMQDEEGGFPYRGKGYRFFTLDELFERFPGEKFNIVLMGENSAPATIFCKLVAENGNAERLLVSSNTGKIIKLVRRRLPHVATSFSISEIVGYYALFRTGVLAFRKKFPGDVIITPEYIGTSHIGNQGLMSSAAKRGIRVYITGVSSRKQAEELRLSGADGFITGDLSLLENIE